MQSLQTLRTFRTLRMMGPAVIGAVAVAAGLLAAALPAVAHHSFAMFDFSKTVQSQVTVQEFRWTNPHVILLVMLVPKPGEAGEVWSMELTSPGNLTRLGWTRKSLAAGDRIDLEFNPLRDGTHGGAFRKATVLATGQVLTSSLRQLDQPDLK